jgi:putative cell wall-binding protein/GH18 family chitinase
MAMIMLFSVFTILGTATAASAANPPGTSKRTVGYLPWWRNTDASSLDYAKLDYVIIAFLRYTGSGWDFGSNGGWSDAELQAIVTQAHAAGTKVFISVGGGDGGFTQTSLPFWYENSREYLANCILEVVDKFGFDGVDMDAETDDIKFWQGYNEFISLLRIGIDARGLELSMAVHTWFTDLIANEAALYENYDFLNVMSYDLQFDKAGNKLGIGEVDQAPLWHSYQLLDHYTNLGVPADKINVGIPFYQYTHGGGWDGAVGYSHVVQFPDADIAIDTKPGESNLDAWKRTTQQKAYLGGTEYGGAFVWELGQDTLLDKPNSLLTMLYNGVKNSTPPATPIDPIDQTYPPLAVVGGTNLPLTAVDKASTQPDFPALGGGATRVALSDYWWDTYAEQTLTVTADSAVTWQVRDGKTDVVTVANGLLTAVSDGYAVVDALVGGKRVASVNVKVSTATMPSQATITNVALQGGQVETPYNDKLNAVGTTPITWSISKDSLPAGLTINETTGAIRGTPTEDGTFTFTVNAHNPVGDTEKEFTIVVTPAPVVTVPPTITTASLAGGTVGSTYSAALQASGDSPITWSIKSGSLPAGLNLNSALGTITGTPTAAGSVTFTVNAHNKAGDDPKQFTIAIAAPATQITPDPITESIALKDGSGSLIPANTYILWQSYHNQYAIWKNSAGMNHHWTNMPKGTWDTGVWVKQFDVADYAAGATTAQGSYVFYSANNGLNGIIYRAKTETSSTPSGAKADNGDWLYVVEANKVSPVICKYPNGATVEQLQADPAYKGAWSSSGAANPYPLGSIVLYGGKYYECGFIGDAYPGSGWEPANKPFWHELTVLSLLPPPVITTSSLPAGKVGEAYSATLAGTGTGSIAWSIISGSLPAGLELNAATGAITGTPSAANTFNITVQATDSNGSASAGLTIVIAPTQSSYGYPDPIVETVATSDNYTTFNKGDFILFMDDAGNYALYKHNWETPLVNHSNQLPGSADDIAVHLWLKEFDLKNYTEGTTYQVGEYVFYDPDGDKTGTIYKVVAAATSAVPGTTANWDEVIASATKVSNAPYVCRFPSGAPISVLEADAQFLGEWSNAPFTDSKGVFHDNDPFAYPAGSVVSYNEKYYEAHKPASAWGGWEPNTHANWHEITILAEPSKFDPEVTRLSDNNRVLTAIAIAKAGWETADTVVLASGANFADALSGGPLAAALDAPLLLTANGAALEPELLKAIDDLKATKVIILGGGGSVKDEFIAALTTETRTVDRLAGGNRYETAIEIAKALAEQSTFDAVFLADGQNFPDALAISPVAALEGQPILFTDSRDTSKLQAKTADYIKAIEAKKAVLIGGTSSVSEAVELELKGNGIEVGRISGGNRYLTAVAIYNEYKGIFADDAVTLATGAKFPDALAGGAFAAKVKSALILVNPVISSITEVKDAIKETGAKKVYVFGGTGSLSVEIIEANILRDK